MVTRNKNYIDFAVGFLEGSGLSPTSKFYRKFISLCIMLPMTFILVYLILKKVWGGERDVLLIAEVFEALTTCAHLLQRKYVMFIYGKVIKEVTNDRNKYFWKYNIINEKLGVTLERKMIICSRIIKIVVSGGFFTVILFCLTTIFDKTKPVPLMCWTPEKNYFLTGVIYVMQVLIMLEIMYALLSADCFYLLICTDLRIQFILLRKMLKNITLGNHNDQKNLLKIIDCTRHHKFLLRFHGKLNTIFSSYFIMLYLVTVACASMHSYIILFKSPSLSVSLKSVCYLGGMLFQVGLYFVITSNIEIEAENLSGEIYNINWEATSNLKIRKHILFMLMKSQKPVTITGGGMLHVNRNEYVGLVRLAYSIATILGGMS